MTAPAATFNLSATVSAASGPIAIGDAVVPIGGVYYKATAANRATAAQRAHGMATSAWSSSTTGSVSVQHVGIIDGRQSGLVAGAASWVRVSATGTLERCTPAGADDVVGYCAADGTLFALFGSWTAAIIAGGSGATLPIDLTTDVTGILPEANGGTGSATLPAGGLAGLTAMAAGDALAESNAATTSAAAIVTERSAVRAITNATIAGASNTLTVRIANDVTGLGSNVAAWLAAASSANLLAAMTDKTGTGLCVFDTAALFRTTINLNNPANTFKYVITPAAILADRILNLPLLGATDTVAVLAFAQTFTNKTMVLASNTVTDTGMALGDIAYCNGTRFVRFARGTTGQTLTSNATTIAWSNNPAVAAVAIAALAIDWSLGTVFTKTLSAGANTFTFSNQASGMVITVRVTGAASTLTWPTVKWAGGAAPTQTASGIDVYTFVHDGTSVYGSVVQAMA